MVFILGIRGRIRVYGNVSAAGMAGLQWFSIIRNHPNIFPGGILSLRPGSVITGAA